METLEKIHSRLEFLLNKENTKVDAIYFCPHLPDDLCDCRKPQTAMARRAAVEFDTKLSESFMIGDNVGDIELGKNINATTILVRTGYGKKIEQDKIVQPDYVVNDLFEAACLIKKILENSEDINFPNSQP